MVSVSELDAAEPGTSLRSLFFCVPPDRKKRVWVHLLPSGHMQSINQRHAYLLPLHLNRLPLTLQSAAAWTDLKSERPLVIHWCNFFDQM